MDALKQFGLIMKRTMATGVSQWIPSKIWIWCAKYLIILEVSRFSWLDVVHFLEKNPELAQINADVPHKSVFDVDHRVMPDEDKKK